jgi:hypothetical protein
LSIMKEKIKRFVKKRTMDGGWIIVLFLLGIGLILNLLAYRF